jgi:DNA-binding CsgD family transcriptional regulator
MSSVSLGRTFGASVAIVAVLHALSGVTMPELARRPGPLTLATSLGLLLVHATLYWFGNRVRERYGLSRYAGTQAVAMFGVAVSGVPGALTLGLLVLLTVELVLLSGPRWTTPIVAAAIALFVLAEVLTSGLYQAAAAGVVLALTGAIAHGVAALMRRRLVEPAPVPAASAPRPFVASGNLSAREIEVVRELVAGARNSDIAATLGISERTVKSHLANIYLKLGVESRSAAVAQAVQRGLV